jgi:hypothetical protein
MIVATALMMTVPDLALFYSGMVRKKNVLATMVQSRGGHELEGLDIRSTARLQIPHRNTFLVPSSWAELCPDSVLLLF